MNALITLLVLLGTALSALGYDDATQSYFPRLTPPRSLWVAKTWTGGSEPTLTQGTNAHAASAEMILLQSLSGVLLKQGCPEGLFLEPNLSHRLILRDLARRRSLPVTYAAGPQTVWELAARFQTQAGASARPMSWRCMWTHARTSRAGIRARAATARCN
jgi:hypothetical protein